MQGKDWCYLVTFAFWLGPSPPSSSNEVSADRATIDYDFRSLPLVELENVVAPGTEEGEEEVDFVCVCVKADGHRRTQNWHSCQKKYVWKEGETTSKGKKVPLLIQKRSLWDAKKKVRLLFSQSEQKRGKTVARSVGNIDCLSSNGFLRSCPSLSLSDGQTKNTKPEFISWEGKWETFIRKYVLGRALYTSPEVPLS